MSKQLSIGDIRKKIKDKQTGGFNRNTNVYPFWNMEYDSQAIVRLLPDGNDENPLAFVEKLEHSLDIDGERKKITCPSMFGDSCPICALSKKYYDADDKDNGKYYYRNKANLAKALILKDPLPKDEDGNTYEGKVMTLHLGFQIMGRLMESLATDFDDSDPLPWDMKEGFNFRIKKVNSGGRPNYALGSGFERKPSSIPREYLENIEELTDLSTLLPERPSVEEVQQLLDRHLSGDSPASEDSLESKKRKSSSDEDSSNTSLLDNLKNEKLADDTDDDAEGEDVNEDTSNPLPDDDDSEVDEDDLINRIRNRKKASS